MNTHMPRFARYALLLLSLMIVLVVAIALHALITAQPTTLTSMLAVRTFVSGCHTTRAVAVTGTIRASIATDPNGGIRMEVTPSYDVNTVAQSLPGDVPPITVERHHTVVDNSVMFHQPIAPRRVGMLVTRVYLPC